VTPLALLASLLPLAAAVPAGDSIHAPPYVARRLAEGVYAVLGDTGRGSEGRSNAGFIVTPGGVVVVDALASPRQGEALLRTIRGVTRQPIRWLILTHHHPDHTFGAVVFRRAGAKVIAHPDARTLASEGGPDALLANWVRTWPAVLPNASAFPWDLAGHTQRSSLLTKISKETCRAVSLG